MAVTDVVVPPGPQPRSGALSRYRLEGDAAWSPADPDLVRSGAEAARRWVGARAAIVVLDGAAVRVLRAGTAEAVRRARGSVVCDRVLALGGDGSPTVVDDVQADPRLVGATVGGGVEPVRSYASVPLVDPGGVAFGTVCLWSAEPNRFGAAEVRGLVEWRDEVTALLERRADPVRSQRPAGAGAAVASASASWDIARVLDEGAVTTVFQPVVHLATGTVVGFEALSRGPAGSPLESPLALLDAARSAGRLGELDWLCRVRAMQRAAAARLHPSLSWLINVEPAGITTDCPPHLLGPLAQARGGLRVILEVIEREDSGYATDLMRAVDRARTDSWGVALDNVGAHVGSLALLPLLRPDVIKLDMRVLRSGRSLDAAAVTAATGDHAERTGAVLLAEGIETEEDHQLATVFGATYGQGWFYGPPGPLPSAVPPPRHVIPLTQHLAPASEETPFEVLARLQTPRVGHKAQLFHISRHLEQRCGMEGPSVLLVGFEHHRYYSGRTAIRLREVAEHNALTVVLGQDLLPMSGARWLTGPPRAGGRFGREWITIVVGPHHAAAFVARACDDTGTGTDASRRFEYFYTHDRDAVTAVARTFLNQVKPLQQPA